MKRKITNTIVISTIMLVVSLFIAKPASAALLPIRDVTMWNYDIKYGQYEWSSNWYDKEDFAYNYVKVDAAKTAITNPCPKCQVSFRLKSNDGARYTGTLGLTTTSANYKMPCTDGCSVPGTYAIGAMRVDTTLMTTTIDFTWRYQ